MDASTDLLYHLDRHGFTTEEVGTTVKYDVDDVNSHHPFNHGLVLVSNILRTVEREHPVLLLGVPGFIAALFGVGLTYFTFSNYIATGSFPLGVALTASVFLLVGVFSCFTAIILHSIQSHFPDQ